MQTPVSSRHRLGLTFMVLLMCTAAPSPAAATAEAVPASNSPSDGSRLLRTPSAEPVTLSDSDSSTAADHPPLPGDTLHTISSSGSSTTTSNSGAYNTEAFGTNLRPYEQCGGIGGSCNTTTIGVPCGDHVWNGVNCPTYYYCARQNGSFWSCQPQPPEVVKAAEAAQKNTTQDPRPNVTETSELTPDGQFTANAAAGDGSRSRSRSSNTGGAAVPVCGPGQTGQNTAMCRASTTSDGVLVLDRNSTSTAGHQSGAAGQHTMYSVGAAYMLALLMLLLAVVGSA